MNFHKEKRNFGSDTTASVNFSWAYIGVELSVFLMPDI